jgi:hypothetical protein
MVHCISIIPIFFKTIPVQRVPLLPLAGETKICSGVSLSGVGPETISFKRRFLHYVTTCFQNKFKFFCDGVTFIRTIHLDFVLHSVF